MPHQKEVRLLNGKVALITGTSRGIGRSILECFAAHGAIVYANAREEGCMDVVAEELGREHDTQVIPLYFDVRDERALKSAFMRVQKEQGRIDALVNNAGVMQDALLGMINMDSARETFEVNVFSVMNATQIAARLMRRQKSGSIVNLASIVGVNGNAGQAVYSASKGAIVALTKTAAKELAEQNIRVNAIAPGMIDTEMFRSIGEERVAERLALIPMGRLGSPEDIAKAAVFLASDLSDYITGQILGVDGGAIV